MPEGTSAPDIALVLSPQPRLARRQLRHLLLRKQWPGDVDAVLLAIHEAITNANVHGGGATGATAHLDGPTLYVEVCDCGGGFTVPSRNVVPGILDESGRGLWIICQVATECAVHHGDGAVCLKLRFDP